MLASINYRLKMKVVQKLKVGVWGYTKSGPKNLIVGFLSLEQVLRTMLKVMLEKVLSIV